MPASKKELAKRAFVSVLLELARSYNVAIDVTRDTADAICRGLFGRWLCGRTPTKEVLRQTRNVSTTPGIGGKRLMRIGLLEAGLPSKPPLTTPMET